jgi:hypothetical protein
MQQGEEGKAAGSSPIVSAGGYPRSSDEAVPDLVTETVAPIPSIGVGVELVTIVEDGDDDDEGEDEEEEAEEEMVLPVAGAVVLI